MKIQKLTLQARDLNELRKFYSEVLGFKENEIRDQFLSYQIGETELIFEIKAQATPYHFAFNIPSNQIKEARDWLKERTEILTHEGDEIQDFDTWNAQAIYCHDPFGNIIEFIARENVNEHSNSTFTALSLISVSEIGVVSEDNIKIHDQLHESFGIPVFKGDKTLFSALGDDEGLFICMDRTKRKWFPTAEEAFCSNFMIEFTQNGRSFSLHYQNQELIEI